MSSVHLTLSEMELVKIVLEFLELRGLHISQVSLERETGLINGVYSDDGLFLRQLIIDGQWDNVLEFVQPLTDAVEFESRQFRYLVLRYKYFELLCIKQEPGPMHDNDFTVEELVECLHELEHLSPSQEEYRNLCALLTLPRLSDHVDFRNWNPSSARVECFAKVYPLVKKFLPSAALGGLQASQNLSGHSDSDRLLQLAAKGLLYEACVDFCQVQAVRDDAVQDRLQMPNLLDIRPKLSNTDLSLASWLETLSCDQFALPFEQKVFDLKIESLQKPQLNAHWTEHILATPMKPDRNFPHSAVPSDRLKSAEKLSQSLICPAAVVANPFQTGLMSRSSVPVGFSISKAIPNAPSSSLLSSQLDVLFETSELTRSTCPEPFCPPRLHLEELARKNAIPVQTHKTPMLAPVPEVETPTNNDDDDDDDAMQGSRLVHQFVSRQSKVVGQDQPTPVDAYQMVKMNSISNQNLSFQQQHQQQQQHSVSRSPSKPTFPGASDCTSRRLQYPLHQKNDSTSEPNVQFVAVTKVDDSQAIRAVAFHPSGRYFAVGTNSKQLHICKYPDVRNIWWAK